MGVVRSHNIASWEDWGLNDEQDTVQSDSCLDSVRSHVGRRVGFAANKGSRHRWESGGEVK